MKIICAKSIFLVISTCFMLSVADRSCAIELYKNLSVEYGDLNLPCADSKDVKAATDYKAAADVKTAVDAKVPESEKIAVPGVLTAKYGLNISKDFLPYVGAGMAYRIQSEVKPGDATQQISAGVAGQAGLKYLVNRNSSLSLDYKYLNLGPDESRCGTKAPPQSVGFGFNVKF